MPFSMTYCFCYSVDFSFFLATAIMYDYDLPSDRYNLTVNYCPAFNCLCESAVLVLFHESLSNNLQCIDIIIIIGKDLVVNPQTCIFSDHSLIIE